MKITNEALAYIWYEDREGNKYFPTMEDNPSTIDPNFCFQYSRFPFSLQTQVLYIVEPDVVANCEHLEEHIIINYENNKMISRTCMNCNGKQFYINDKWPDEWQSGHSIEYMTFNSSWSEDLAVAIYNNSKDYTLCQAIIIAANCCERCMNSLAHKYGLSWGYPEFSEEWKKVNTTCEFCKNEKQYINNSTLEEIREDDETRQNNDNIIGSDL